jgi:hypothetical protein
VAQVSQVQQPQPIAAVMAVMVLLHQLLDHLSATQAVVVAVRLAILVRHLAAQVAVAQVAKHQVGLVLEMELLIQVQAAVDLVNFKTQTAAMAVQVL